MFQFFFISAQTRNGGTTNRDRKGGAYASPRGEITMNRTSPGWNPDRKQFVTVLARKRSRAKPRRTKGVREKLQILEDNRVLLNTFDGRHRRT